MIYPWILFQTPAFSVRKLHESECCLLMEVDNVNYALELGSTHLNSCYYHKTVWEHQSWGQKVPELLVKLWLLLTMPPQKPVKPRFAGMGRPVPIPVLSLALQICPLPIKGGPLAVSAPGLFKRDRTGWFTLSHTRTFIRCTKNQFPMPENAP